MKRFTHYRAHLTKISTNVCMYVTHRIAAVIMGVYITCADPNGCGDPKFLNNLCSEAEVEFNGLEWHGMALNVTHLFLKGAAFLVGKLPRCPQGLVVALLRTCGC